MVSIVISIYHLALAALSGPISGRRRSARIAARRGARAHEQNRTGEESSTISTPAGAADQPL